jgi:Methyltransferase domain
MTSEHLDVDALVRDLVDGAMLTGASLSRPRRGDPSRPSRVTVVPVTVGGSLRYRFTAHQATRTTDENLTPEATIERLAHLLDTEYRQGLLQSTDADWQVLVAGARATILRRPPSRPTASLAHDRVKRRLLPEGIPVPFLIELGVMTREGKVRAQRYDKFRQVNRFLELVEDVLPSLPAGPLRIVDFGSGKSYLTFALHHLLTVLHQREVEIAGLDLKAEVVDDCEALARKLGCIGLHFEVGDIAGYKGLAGVDLVVSLHACDTATDDALDRAVRARARVILAVPCCQHELLSQLENTALDPLLRHGTLRERFAAEVTDAARAQLLGAVGYDVQVLEFVELEHTPKNILLRAVARPGRDTAKALAEYRAFAAELGIDPALARLLADMLPGVPG